MGGKKILILIENEINNHQIYVRLLFDRIWNSGSFLRPKMQEKRLLCCLSMHGVGYGEKK